MAQYKTGTVSVTNGSATVTGSGTLWSGEIAAGDLFTIVGDNAWYEVASVGSNTSITLSANYAGTTGSGKSYAISRDFTTRLALPYPQKGDIETASIIKRAFEQIDTETNIATANYSATSAPTANDDSGDGYSIGSWWVNVTSDEAYLCVDATVGAAVWTKISVDVPSEIVALLAGQSVSMASLTLSGGTANGVLYLNGSKVATSGSALTFDGTYFTVGASATTGDYKTFIQKAGGELLGLNASSGTLTRIAFGNATASFGSTQIIANASDLAFITNSAEQMRLTSTGLGIGTSSPGAKLDVNGSIYAGGAVALSINSAGSNYGQIGYNTGVGDVYWLGYGNSKTSAGTAVLNWNSSGNLGLGVTPSAWATVTPAIELKNGVHFAAINTGTPLAYLGANCYYDGSNWIYKVSANYAARYELNAGGVGAHGWFTTSSGTAGATATFTQSMTLTAAGNLGLGTTSPNIDGGTATAFTVNSASSGARLELASGGTRYGQFYAGSGGAYLTAYTAIPLVFEVNGSERARIDSSGNLLVAKTSSGAASTPGCEFGSYGAILTRDGGDALLVNRETSDGAAVTLRRSNTTVGTISVTTSATAYNTSSDYRLKDNPQPLTGSGAFIDALKPKTWNWKADGSVGVGFIAHEVQEVSPGSVVGEKDGEQMQAMEYGSAEFIANIIAELQSLRARVAALES